MSYSDVDINEIIRKTVEGILANNKDLVSGAAAAAAQVPSARQGEWLFEDANDAIEAAIRSQKELMGMSMEKRGQIIEAMRVASRANAEYLAKLAHEETGYGHTEHKVLKNLLAADKTPGIEDLQTGAYSGDNGLTIVEGAPFGVVGSITPSTNPTSTVINNSISMIAAGNAVVYNPHPAAKHCSQEAMRILNEAIKSAGGPAALITTIK